MDVQGEGAPLVLVHGVGTSRVVWRRVMPLLAQDRLVAAPDLPGFGASPADGPGFALERAAARSRRRCVPGSRSRSTCSATRSAAPWR